MKCETASVILLPFLDYSGSRNGSIFLYESNVSTFGIRDLVAAFFEDETRADRPDSAITAAVEELHIAVIATTVLAVGGPAACGTRCFGGHSFGYVYRNKVQLDKSFKVRARCISMTVLRC